MLLKKPCASLKPPNADCNFGLSSALPAVLRVSAIENEFCVMPLVAGWFPDPPVGPAPHVTGLPPLVKTFPLDDVTMPPFFIGGIFAVSPGLDKIFPAVSWNTEVTLEPIELITPSTPP